jgi:DNA-binding LytR/AlgR family response regulator
MTAPKPILLHRPDGRRLVTDPADIYYLEADGDDTLVRFRGKDRVRDVRRLSELEETLRKHGFVRTHRSYLVNTARVREIRPRDESRYWELVLEPPVNRILPISNTHLDAVLAAYD